MVDNVIPNGLERQLNFNSAGLNGITNNQINPDVVALPDGTYVVAYESFNGVDNDVYAIRLDANGQPVGPNLGLSYGNQQTLPSLGARTDNGFVIAYQDNFGFATNYIRLQNFEPADAFGS